VDGLSLCGAVAGSAVPRRRPRASLTPASTTSRGALRRRTRATDGTRRSLRCGPRVSAPRGRPWCLSQSACRPQRQPRQPPVTQCLGLCPAPPCPAPPRPARPPPRLQRRGV
jgi:hypothetical protein